MKWEIDKESENTQWISGAWIKMNSESVAVIVSNRDLYCSPFGWGQTEQEAFTRMLDNIDEHRTKLDKVESEIRQILMENGEMK